MPRSPTSPTPYRSQGATRPLTPADSCRNERTVEHRHLGIRYGGPHARRGTGQARPPRHARQPYAQQARALANSDPLDFSSGRPGLLFGATDSLGERIQRLLPEARVVKALNIVADAAK